MNNLVEQKPRVERKTLRRMATQWLRSRLWSYWRPILLGLVAGWWVGSWDWRHASLTSADWLWHVSLDLGWGPGPGRYLTAAVGVVLGARSWWWFRWTEQKFIEHDRTLRPGDTGTQDTGSDRTKPDHAHPIGTRLQRTATLIISGTFAQLRHPMLTQGVFSFIIAEGFLVGPGAWAWGVIFIPLMALLYIPHEERKLRNEVGKDVYDKYARQVPNRWWPARREKQPLPHDPSCCLPGRHA